MTDDSRISAAEAVLIRWRRIAIISALAAGCSLLLLAATAFLAVQSLGENNNLYYLLWKAGIRPYERPIAFGGLSRDHHYRQRYIGMSVEQFERAFPNTFYKARTQRPDAKPNQEFYINDYEQAQRDNLFWGMGWQTVFENGRLIEFDTFKA